MTKRKRYAWQECEWQSRLNCWIPAQSTKKIINPTVRFKSPKKIVNCSKLHTQININQMGRQITNYDMCCQSTSVSIWRHEETTFKQRCENNRPASPAVMRTRSIQLDSSLEIFIIDFYFKCDLLLLCCNVRFRCLKFARFAYHFRR